MYNLIVLIWVGLIFFAAVFFASLSLAQLVQNKRIAFDKGFLLSLSACLVSLLLCISVWPPFYHVYEDEFSYTSQSVDILYSGQASIIIKGRLLHPEAVIPWTANPKLPGYAFLEAVILFFTKDFYHSYFILNIVLGTLLVGLVYRITWVLTASHAAAWWAAVFLACLPVRITYSMSAASDIAGSFFFLLFFLFICEYRSLKTRRILYAALFCGVYSICIKPFYAILVILGLAIILSIYKREGVLDRKLYSQIFSDTFCLFLPILFASPVFLFSDINASGYSASFVFKNIYTSFSYLFDQRQNTALTALAVLFAVLRNIFYKKDNLVSGLTCWFLMGVLMISVFFAGGISYPGKAYSDRYFLFFVFPFVFLAAKGAVDLTSMARPRFLLGLLLFFILVSNAYFILHKYAARAKKNGYYNKVLLLKQMARLIPDKAYLIDECAAYIAIETSMKPIQTTSFLNGDHPQEVVFLKGLPDFSYPYRTTMAQNILNTAYRCKPLSSTPFIVADLSATPLLCTRK